MTKGEQLNYNAAGGDMILISIKTKDGLTLEGAYMKNDRVDVKTTMVLFGGMVFIFNIRLAVSLVEFGRQIGSEMKQV